MGLFDEDYSVGMAESRVRAAEARVASEKRNRETAKANDNYKNTPKTYRLANGKSGNGYNVNVYSAERALKEAKEQLARAKERAREAKKRKQEEAKKAKAASKATSSRSSSSFSSAKSSATRVSSIATSSSKSPFSYSEPSSYSHSESSYSTSDDSLSYSTSDNEVLKNANRSCERDKITKTTRKWIVTLILCVFFGALGAHRFYVGKVGTGILQLFTAGGYFIWVFVDLIHILTGKFTDSEGNVIRVGL